MYYGRLSVLKIEEKESDRCRGIHIFADIAKLRGANKLNRSPRHGRPRRQSGRTKRQTNQEGIKYKWRLQLGRKRQIGRGQPSKANTEVYMGGTCMKNWNRVLMVSGRIATASRCRMTREGFPGPDPIVTGSSSPYLP